MSPNRSTKLISSIDILKKILILTNVDLTSVAEIKWNKGLRVLLLLLEQVKTLILSILLVNRLGDVFILLVVKHVCWLRFT